MAETTFTLNLEELINSSGREDLKHNAAALGGALAHIIKDDRSNSHYEDDTPHILTITADEADIEKYKQMANRAIKLIELSDNKLISSAETKEKLQSENPAQARQQHLEEIENLALQAWSDVESAGKVAVNLTSAPSAATLRSTLKGAHARAEAAQDSHPSAVANSKAPARDEASFEAEGYREDLKSLHLPIPRSLNEALIEMMVKEPLKGDNKGTFAMAIYTDLDNKLEDFNAIKAEGEVNTTLNRVVGELLQTGRDAANELISIKSQIAPEKVKVMRGKMFYRLPNLNNIDPDIAEEFKQRLIDEIVGERNSVEEIDPAVNGLLVERGDDNIQDPSDDPDATYKFPQQRVRYTQLVKSAEGLKGPNLKEQLDSILPKSERVKFDSLSEAKSVDNILRRVSTKPNPPEQDKKDKGLSAEEAIAKKAGANKAAAGGLNRVLAMEPDAVRVLKEQMIPAQGGGEVAQAPSAPKRGPSRTMTRG